MKRLVRNLDLLVVLLMAIVLAVQLLVPPIVGLANNGDFERMMLWGGLKYRTDDFDEKYFNYVVRYFDVATGQPGSYVSSEVLFLKLALLVNPLFAPDSTFDIRSVGFVHSIAFLAAMLAIVTGIRKLNLPGRRLIALLLFAAFADVGYYAYFNSFYSESASLIFLLAMFGFALHLAAPEGSRPPQSVPDSGRDAGEPEQKSKPNYWVLSGFFLTALCLVLAKVQNAPLGFLLPLFGLRLMKLHPDKRWKRTVASFSALILLVSLAMSAFNPFDRINTYQTVFYGILKDSPDPRADLKELGLSEEYAVLAGTNYFTPDKKIDIHSEEFARGYYDRISKRKVAVFYLKHPARFFKKLDVVAKNSLNNVFYLGNYEKSANRGPLAQSRDFSQWTWILNSVFPKSIWFLIAYAALFLGFLYREHRRSPFLRGKLLMEFLLLLVVMAMLQFVIPLLGDGEADLAKHLFLFNALFSLTVVVSLVWLGRKLNVPPTDPY